MSGRTPGRRGEKRRRPEDAKEEDERRRKAGRIISDRIHLDLVDEGLLRDGSDVPDNRPVSAPPIPPDEDIFGKPGPSSLVDSPDQATDTASANRAKRVRVPQVVLENKAVRSDDPLPNYFAHDFVACKLTSLWVIRKQTLVLPAERGVPREDAQFKEVFGMTTKGVAFAFVSLFRRSTRRKS